MVASGFYLMIKKTITGKELIYKHQKENKALGGSLRHPVQRRRPRKAEPLTKPCWLRPGRKLQSHMLGLKANRFR